MMTSTRMSPIDQENYKRLNGYLTDLTQCRSAEHMTAEFRRLHFEPYAPIRRQPLTYCVR